MTAGQWLLLTDYASKYRISVSTLRRRIKAGQIQHRLEHGKYYLFDDANFGAGETAPLIAQGEESSQQDEPIISTATKLLNELKRAYMNILQEKEEQIIQLKEEVTDLKTLVRVLEDDNERLRRGGQVHHQPHL